MRVVFFGTPVIAANVLTFLFDNDIEIIAVVTRPDAPQGRGQRLVGSPVKIFCEKMHAQIPIYQPSRVSSPDFDKVLTQLNPDIFVVFAYGEILREHILNIPKYGCINLHPSLLPKYRGASPIRAPLLAGDEYVGVSVIKMVLKMDAGPILSQRSVRISQDMNYEELESLLVHMGGQLLYDVLKDFESGQVVESSQNDEFATYVTKTTTMEAKINWNQSVQSIHNQIRAFSPRPGAWSEVVLNGVKRRIKIFKSKVILEHNPSIPSLSIISCQKGRLQLLELQLEGKKRLLANEFFNGIQSFSIC